MGKFISILPESREHVLCIGVDGPITAEDYNSIFLNQVKEISDRYGELHLLVHYRNFVGWMPEAVGEDMEAVARYGRYLKKFALVNAPEREIMNHKIKWALFKGPVKVYANDEFNSALDWVSR